MIEFENQEDDEGNTKLYRILGTKYVDKMRLGGGGLRINWKDIK